MSGFKINNKFIGPSGTVSGYSRRADRENTFYAGDLCQIEPSNPQKKKHLGRVCKLIDVERKYGQIVVKFVDNGRRGIVDISDLLPVEMLETSI